eukprot:6211471-Pleurochrysis_carterae.AAC.2
METWVLFSSKTHHVTQDLGSSRWNLREEESTLMTLLHYPRMWPWPQGVQVVLIVNGFQHLFDSQSFHSRQLESTLCLSLRSVRRGCASAPRRSVRTQAPARR